MALNCLKIRVCLSIVGLSLFLNNLFALPGSQIIENAGKYRTFTWTCNIWNARPGNTDGLTENNDTKYPFYTAGAKYFDENNVEQTSTGQHTGVPYAWGLRETTTMFGGSHGTSGKLTWTYAGKHVLAGNHDKKYEDKSTDSAAKKQENAKNRYRLWSEYTGIDCSGLVWNAAGMPALPRASSPYSLCRFNTGHIMNGNGMFSDSIEWDEIQKGDILIKDGHVAITSSNPANNRVNVIEAAVKWAGATGGYKPQVVENYYEKNSTTIFRGRETGSTGYQPRRLSPPYIKRLTVYVPVIKNGLIDNYEKVIENEWQMKSDNSGLELVSVIDPKPVCSDKIFVEIEFTKAMCVKPDHADSWQEISVSIKSGSDSAKVLKALDGGDGKLLTKCNSGTKLDKGWGKATEIGDGKVYIKWVGEIETKDLSSGINTIHVTAKSLMQDELDTNPATIARRTDGGGWTGYESGTDTNHKITIIPKDYVLYLNAIPTPGPTETPVGGEMYSDVIV